MSNNTFSNSFLKQSELLIEVMPFVAQEHCFALKGGTAINFFLQEMPRLSIDIDLTYLPISVREESLSEIRSAILRIAESLKIALPKATVNQISTKEGFPKLLIENENGAIKIEANSIFRGSIFPSAILPLARTAQKIFKSYVEMQVESVADVYGGKLCAAFTRQHPRDLFDVKMLVDHHGITDDIRLAFVIHAASDRRPIHEVLAPNIKRYSEEIFNGDFSGMLREHISYDTLIDSLSSTLSLIKSQLTLEEKQFLITLAEGSPDWNCLKIPHLADLPALQWKLLNVQKMDEEKRTQSVNALTEVLHPKIKIEESKIKSSILFRI